MPVPNKPKIYHIVHVDRLPSIIREGGLLSDAEVTKRSLPGTNVGMSKIKRRRLTELNLSCYPDLFVGSCVPFYFCPRSIMLFILDKGNHPEIDYSGGQAPIVHLEADLYRSVEWADQNQLRWAFTWQNAGTRFFEAYKDLSDLDKINWEAVQAKYWSDPDLKEGKQAEFLMETSYPWHLFERIGVITDNICQHVLSILSLSDHGNYPMVEKISNWYY